MLDMLNFLTFLFLLSFVIHGTTQTSVEYPYRSCLAANFTPNSTYQSSLNLLFANLSNLAPGLINRFYNTSVGRTPDDTVYGLFQCRGDVDNDTCRNCLATATRDVAEQYCPLRKGAVIWYDECIFRYSNRYFFSVVSRDPSQQLLNTDDIDVDKARFNQLVLWILTGTAASASSVGEMFATQEANFTSDEKLYTLAQCTSDLSSSSCGECLREAIKNIPSCCTNKRGGRVLFPSCYVRYEVYPFYSLPVSFPTTPAPTWRTPPQPPPLPSPSSGGSSRSSRVIIVAIVASIAVSIAMLIVVVVVGWCFLRRRAKKKSSSVAEEDGGICCSIVIVLKFK